MNQTSVLNTVVTLVSVQYIRSKKWKVWKVSNPTQLSSWILSFPFVHLLYIATILYAELRFDK